MIFFGILVGLIVLMLLVVVHEYGHYIAARKNGVWVEEFGIGLPPKAWGKKLKSGMLFSLNWLPLGGFCKMKGESDDSKEKGSFGQASFWGKTKILFAGVFMNFAAAALILTILSYVGMPVLLSNQFKMSGGETWSDAQLVISEVREDSPAAQAGISSGDEIVWLGAADSSNSILALSDWTRENAGENVQIGVIKEGASEISVVEVALNPAGSDYYLGTTAGVKNGGTYYQGEWWQGPIIGVATTVQFTGETVKGVGTLLWNLVSGVFKQVSLDADTRDEGREEISKAGDGVSGPVGIVGMVFPMFVQLGFVNLMFITAIISISLAVMNILPIPALDGGRWTLIAVYKARKKVLTQETEAKIVGRSFMVLMGIFVLVTIIDITRFFR
jgi:regulator of sigma E protease